jgi:glycosyltransferase involved in cell wall biosynthesis
MKILISTGIYPPKIGGPSEYSKNLKNALEMAQNRVKIGTFGIEEYIPTGLRHLYFMVKILPKVLWSDLVISMDTFSAAFPTILVCKILNKKNIIRTGGDFLWEQYVERTKKKVLFRIFYETEKKNFSLKEKIIFNLTKWTLQNTDHVVFSTEWQRDIFISSYNLDKNKTKIIENYYGEKEDGFRADSKEFVASTRVLVWKNLDLLKSAFAEIRNEHPGITVYTENEKYEDFMKRMKNSYAVILVSLGDISPNMILDALRLNKPFICTREVGIYERIKDTGIFVDPLNKDEIKSAILRLLDESEYKIAIEKVKGFSFLHSWQDIASEFTNLSNSIK